MHKELQEVTLRIEWLLFAFGIFCNYILKRRDKNNNEKKKKQQILYFFLENTSQMSEKVV